MKKDEIISRIKILKETLEELKNKEEKRAAETDINKLWKKGYEEGHADAYATAIYLIESVIEGVKND